MSPKSFSVLLAGTVVAVGLAVWAVAEREVPAASRTVDEPLFAGLADRLGEVTAIEAEAEGKSVTVRKDGEVWRVVERGGYPADPAKVREVARALTGLRIVEAKTASADRLPRLELGDPEADKAKSRRVSLEGADGKPIASAILGKAKYGLYGGGRGGIYVRRDGETQSWLAAGEVNLPDDAMGWIDNQVVDLPERQIARVTLGAGSADPIVITRPDADKETLALDTVPEGRQADQEAMSRVTGLLEGLSMSDVRPGADKPVPETAPRARFETRDGLVVGVALLTEGEGDAAKHWVTLEVEKGQPAAEPAETPGPAAEAATPAPAAEAAPAKVEPADQAKPLAERVEELRRRLGGWQFELPSYLAERLTYDRDKLLAKPEGTS
jgi:hypothetical protein